MRYSKLLIPTLKEAPADAEVVSHTLMIRAGYIRKLAAGIYTYLPLCVRVLTKISNIVREEMNAAGAQEILLPIIMPAEIWQESGRWEVYDKELLRLKDRHNRDFCVGPTHEEAVTDLVRREVSSYRDMPLNLYQIQTKFRDETRPRYGLMRGREFIMKDAYSFDRDRDASAKTYQRMFDAYKKIFTRCGLTYRAVEAGTGNIGGNLSHEFQVLAESGEDEILSCDSCDYAANVEKAELKPVNREPKPVNRKGEYKKVKTPNKKTVEEVCEFLKTTPDKLVKTLIIETDKGPIAGLVRGDHALKESKLKDAIAAEWCHFADEDSVKKVTKAPSGFAGPVGLKIPVYADHAVAGMDSFVVGANENDTHLVDVTLGDFEVTAFHDIRRAVTGDSCPRCDGTMTEYRGIEVGQVFYLGTKYSTAMKATFLDEEGKEQIIEMGCYGIGIGRTAAAAIEQNHDERGIIWPLPIAPFAVEVIPMGKDDDVWQAAEKIYKELNDSGVEVLIDDRSERPGVKFADADLIGIPYYVVVGSRGLKEGKAEVKDRRTGDVEKIEFDKVAAHLIGGVLKGAS